MTVGTQHIYFLGFFKIPAKIAAAACHHPFSFLIKNDRCVMYCNVPYFYEKSFQKLEIGIQSAMWKEGKTISRDNFHI